MFSYKIEHDYGLAPNPFGGYCTLAVCKGKIRGNKSLKIGDWIIGTGSRALEKISSNKHLDHLIFAMQVEEIISFNQYWSDPRFQYKKPVINGSLVQLYGDNLYHKDSNGKWIQKNSAHSLISGGVNREHLTRDTKSEKVLISQTFYYFGDGNIAIPEKFSNVCCKGRDFKSTAISQELEHEFISWLTANFGIGIYGDPINWIEHSKTINS